MVDETKFDDVSEEDSQDTLHLSLQRSEVPVVLHDPKTGEKRRYALREMSGIERDAHFNKMTSIMKTDKHGRTTVSDFRDFQAGLIRKCLFDDEGKKVEINVIQQFPAHVQQALFDKSQEINKLDVKPEDLEGND